MLIMWHCLSEKPCAPDDDGGVSLTHANDTCDEGENQHPEFFVPPLRRRRYKLCVFNGFGFAIW